MNLSDLLKMGIIPVLDPDGGLRLDAPKGALTPDLLDQIRHAKPGLIVEISGACGRCEVGELHASMFSTAGKGDTHGGEVHRWEASRAWRFHFADHDPLEVFYSWDASHAEALAGYPAAIAAEPLPGPPSTHLTAEQESDTATIDSDRCPLCVTNRILETAGI